MISAHISGLIRTQALEYWQNEITKDYFISLAQGKEIGHKLADLVDEKTAALLTLHHHTGQQRNKKGRVRARSMGDVWLKDNGIYNAVNVKVGIVGHEGHPNMVSLNKILKAITNLHIDCYYLLIIKFSLQPKITVSVIFADMLDWLNHVSFDAGPGQLMLKAKRFFEDYDPNITHKLTMAEKVEKLFKLYEDGHKRLVDNRAISFQNMQKDVEVFMQRGKWFVTPNSQKDLRIL